MFYELESTPKMCNVGWTVLGYFGSLLIFFLNYILGYAFLIEAKYNEKNDQKPIITSLSMKTTYNHVRFKITS